jgi:hypothetical protein
LDYLLFEDNVCKLVQKSKVKYSIILSQFII